MVTVAINIYFKEKKKSASYKDTYASHEVYFISALPEQQILGLITMKISCLGPDFLPQGLSNERSVLRDNDFFMLLCFSETDGLYQKLISYDRKPWGFLITANNIHPVCQPIFCFD